MTSALQQAVASITWNNYVTIMVLTAIVYDYILTLSIEIDYIWNKPWTRVSTLFVLARYFGLCSAIISALVGSSFLSGPVYVLMLCYSIINSTRIDDVFSCRVLSILATYSIVVFIAATELTMILRVWALYDQSRLIFRMLLTFYVIEVILGLLDCIFYDVQIGTTITDNIAKFTYCVLPPNPLKPVIAANTAQIALSVMMCLLVAIKFVRESLQMYKMTKRVHLNKYMDLLAREGMAYFLVILALALFDILDASEIIPLDGFGMVPSALIETVLPFTLVPRFILNLRELYAHSLRGRRGSNIDTAFGFGSSSGHGRPAVFTGTDENEGVEQAEEQGEEIQLEERVNQ